MSEIPLMGPTYDPEAVQPMRDELTAVGFEELITPDDVDRIIGNRESGETVLLVINSVCGCAAGNARPGVWLALQHTRIPDRLTTVFAGQEKAAVQRAREFLVGYPPSSPCIALFRQGNLLHILERHQIENKTAGQVAAELIRWFDEECDRGGPSVPKEVFEKLVSARTCGSQIPLL